MSLTEMILLAIALSIDATVVSFSFGAVLNRNRLKNALLLAGFTGFFQFFMPIISYFLTDFVKEYVISFSHWIVFVIFMYLGINFIIESKKEKNLPNCLGICCILAASIATSIDAFSAGISISLYNTKILIPAFLIGCITFVNALFGFFIANKLQKFSPCLLEILGGLILIGLAVQAISQ